MAETLGRQLWLSHLVDTVARVLALHRSSRGDLLVERLAEILAVPPDDPFVPDIVAVPTHGVERWLTQRLSLALGTSPSSTDASSTDASSTDSSSSDGPSTRAPAAPRTDSSASPRTDGVCANIEFPFPARLVGTALDAATGIDAGADPWAPDRAVWPLLDVVADVVDEPWMEMVAAHLGRAPDGTFDEIRRSRRWSTVRHLADLFDQYGVHRPGLVQRWATGEDTDADGAPLPADLAWQAPLWRELRSRIGVPSPPERLGPACDLLRAQPEVVDLPERLSVFGLTRLSPSYLEVLVALAAGREVHLWLLHPSESRWASTALAGDVFVGPRRTRGGQMQRAQRRGNPLLVTWGRDAREMQSVLLAGISEADPQPAVTDEAIAVLARPATLLGRVQSAVRDDQEPPGAEADRPLLDPEDRSLQVHSCHGRSRQVEVLRDVILGLLEDDSTLEPRDVIVMCPDIDTFAPLIGATFGPGQKASDRNLHVRLADRSLRQTNPLLTAVATLLDLADRRLTASDILDFAASGPVRRRFGFDDDDLDRLEEWVRSAGVRWGLDAAGRAPFKLSSTPIGTWDWGLNRLALGVAMSEDDLRRFGGVLPLDDVGSGEVESVGRLAELVDRLHEAVATFSSDHRLVEWLALIAEAADSLMACTTAETWQRLELQTILTETAGRPGPPEGGTADTGTADSDGAAESASPLSLREIRSLLARRLEGRPTRANFRTGHLTMCTLVPMRSVPHRVVCLLGLDDGVFPRHPPVDGDDLLARDPYVGDRDAGTEDRQLLLDALLAAGEHLVITYAGRSERTNEERQPSVPVGELLDVIDATVRTSDGKPARATVVVEHPLQSWDPRNFTPGALGVPGSASFDPVYLDASVMAGGRRNSRPGLGGSALGLDRPDPVDLDDLVAFVKHPVRAFLQQRLGIALPHEGTATTDRFPLLLDSLERWQIGNRLLTYRLAGMDHDLCCAAELARGELPPYELGRPLLEDVMSEVEALLSAAARNPGPLGSVDIAVDVGGRLVVGTVNDLDSDQLSSVTFSRLGPRDRVAAWVQLLALTAAQPERSWRARCVGRGGQKGKAAVRLVSSLGPNPTVRAAFARQHLEAVIDLYDRGRAEPLPLFQRTSLAWVDAEGRGHKPEDDARKVWTTAPSALVPGEDEDAAHVIAFGGVKPFEELLEMTPAAGEEGDGWREDEKTRLGRLAHRLWDPLLAQESE